MVFSKKEFRVFDLDLLFTQQVAQQAVEGMNANMFAEAARENGLIPGLGEGPRGRKMGRKGGRKGGAGVQRPLGRGTGKVRPQRKLKKNLR